MGHSCGSLLHDTLVGHFLWDTLKGHSCETLLRDTVAGHSCGTLLWDTLVGQSCRTHASTLQDERFVLDFLHKSRQVSKTRLPPKVTCQVSKTSASRETSSKTHMSKSAKRAYRTRLPPKLKRKHPSEHTHITQPCQAVSRVQPLQTTPAHTPIPMGQRVTSTTTHNLTIPCACHAFFRVHTSNAHKVLRLPRNVISVTPRNLTIPCACHDNGTSTSQSSHKVLRLVANKALCPDPK